MALLLGLVLIEVHGWGRKAKLNVEGGKTIQNIACIVSVLTTNDHNGYPSYIATQGQGDFLLAM